MYGALAGVIGALLVSRLGPKKKGPGKPSVPFTAAVWTILVPIGLVLFAGVLAGQIYLLPPLLIIVALALPWTTTRLLLIPFGLARTAYWLTRTAEVTFDGDLHGGAALAGAWALLRQREPDEATTAWLEDRLRPTPVQTLGGAGLLATGLLLAARGDRDGARAVIGSVVEIDADACPIAARRLAAGWLAADAASRGAWSEVAEIGGGSSAGRQAWLLSAVAQSLLSEPLAPGRLGLWIRWALAPNRRATLPIVRRALDVLDGVYLDVESREAAPPSAAIVTDDAWSTALARHAALLTRPIASVNQGDLLTLGRAWDAILDDRAAERILVERALLIGAESSSRTLARLRDDVEADLTAVVLARDVGLEAPLDAPSPTLDRVRRRVRDQLLAGVEASSDALRRRIDEKREIPAVDEWREWTALRLAYEHGARLGGQEFRRLAFYKVYPDISSLAVWLFNERHQRPLGNAMFKWLLSEATALDDARAIALQTKNVACGI
ncbi:MAG: hypothetical protein ABJE95_11325 [Byssovorax sp.]